MNEITIDQGFTFIAVNWFWMLPALCSAAFILGGFIHFVCGICYAYVCREDDWGSYHKRAAKVMQYPLRECGQHDPADFCLFMIIGIPLGVLMVSIFIHFTPMWALYSLLTTWGVLFAMRSGLDGVRKAKEVLVALDSHKGEKEAHK